MAKLKLAERTPLVVGIDPAVRRSGWALQVYGGKATEYGAVEGIENVGEAVRSIAQTYAILAFEGPIHCFIEYPTWKGPGTDSVRAAANTWIRALRASAIPRGRIKFHKVRPVDWLANYGLARMPKGETQGAYEMLASALLGEPITRDEAAALLIMHYGASRIKIERLKRGAA